MVAITCFLFALRELPVRSWRRYITHLYDPYNRSLLRDNQHVAILVLFSGMTLCWSIFFQCNCLATPSLILDGSLQTIKDEQGRVSTFTSKYITTTGFFSLEVLYNRITCTTEREMVSEGKTSFLVEIKMFFLVKKDFSLYSDQMKSI